MRTQNHELESELKAIKFQATNEKMSSRPLSSLYVDDADEEEEEDDEEGEEHADDLVALRPVAREDVEAAVALDAVAHRQQRVDLVVPRVRLAVGERERKGAEARGDDDLDEDVLQHRASAPAAERLEPEEEAESRHLQV